MLSAAFAKPEQLLRGIYGPDPNDITPFAQFIKGRRPYYQHIAFPSISAQTVKRMESAYFGGGVAPRLMGRTPGSRAFGQAPYQEIMGRIGIIPERLASGEINPMAQRLMMGAEGSEQLILHERFGGKDAMRFGRGANAGRVKVGTGMAVLGRKFNIGGFGTTQQMRGFDAFIVADILKDPLAYAEYGTGHLIAESARKSRGRISNVLKSTMTKMFGEFEQHQAGIMMAPTAKRLQSLGGLGDAWKRAAAVLGVRAPFETINMGGGAVSGPVQAVTGALSFRFTRQAAYSGIRMDPLNFAMMGGMGPSSYKVAQDMLGYTRKSRGREARHALSLLNPFLNRTVNTAGMQVMAPGAIPANLHKIGQVRTAAEVMQLAEAGVLPQRAIALKLDKAIKLPTFEILEAAGGIQYEKAGSQFYVRGWDKLRTSGAAVSAGTLALPGLGAFSKAYAGLKQAVAEGADEDVVKALAEADVYLPKFVRQYGRVLLTAQNMGQMGPNAGVALEGEYMGLLSMFSKHTGKHGLVGRALQPRMLQNRSVYATIQDPSVARLLGNKGRAYVGVGEVGVSRAMAENMGLSKEIVGRLARDRGFEFYVGGQVHPSIVPEASRVMRLRVVEGMSEQNIWTNVADRLAGFRDLDFDAMQLYIFPGYKTVAQKKVLRAAFHEQRGLVQSLFSIAKGGVLLSPQLTPEAAAKAISGPMVGVEGIEKLISTKVLTGPWHNPMRAWQSTALAMYKGEAALPMRILGVAGQLAIQKGRGEAGMPVLSLMNKIGPGALTTEVPGLMSEIDLLASEARQSGILGFGDLTTAQRRGAAERLAAVAQRATATGGGISIRQAFTKQGGVNAKGLLGIMSNVAGGTGGWVDEHLLGMAGLGELRGSTAKMAQEAGIVSFNEAMKREGAEGLGLGGVWKKMPKGLRYAAVGAGALLGLRIAKSWVFGDEPSSPGMRIPPEVAARMAMGPTDYGAPLPPAPILGPGLHSSSMPRPIVPFSPPAARINSPLSRGQSVQIDAMDTQGADLQALGRAFSSTMEVHGAEPSNTGVFASNNMPSTRLTELNEREDRMNSRFYRPV
jgi:hypothetical protein